MPPSNNRAICWIRRDMRLFDHAPLASATRVFEQVAVAFVFDTTILDRLEDRNDRRVTFIHRSLRELDERLREHGSSLVVRHGDPMVEIPKLAAELGASAVFAGRDYEPSAIERDNRVASLLAEAGSRLQLLKDQVVFEAGEVLGSGGQPLRVYTPYARAWKSRLDIGLDSAEHVSDLTRLIPAQYARGWSAPWRLEDLGFSESDLWLEPGEKAGRKRLAQFAEKIGSYGEERDYPAKDATSGLSAHLRFGTVSVRECLRMALAAGPKGEKWLSELVWREFYADILAHHPYVVERPFQAKYEGIEYPGLESHWDAWCEGMTGFPIIDAAMRCLRSTGWMHNRLRMIVASFLTKDLLLDYRRGEAWFARHLLDFDLANNNGGWQWAASTGVDAQPYFRVFNPVLQSTKFDPDGAFIRRWVPELAGLEGPRIHWPHDLSEMESSMAGVRIGTDYPHPIVEHARQRDLAIRLFGSAKNG